MLLLLILHDEGQYADVHNLFPLRLSYLNDVPSFYRSQSLLHVMSMQALTQSCTYTGSLNNCQY